MEKKLLDLKALKDKVNFYDLATYFNEKNITITYNTIKMICPFHKEKTPSFFYSIDKGVYYCQGCHDHGDVINYVINKLNLKTFREAIDFLVNFTGFSPGEIHVKKDNFKKQLNSINKYNKTKETSFTYFTEQDIETMVQFRPYILEKKGFTKETLDLFQVGFDSKEKRLVVPIRDENKVLVGVTGRTILDNYKELEIPKWKHYKNSNINENFFNIYNGISHSKNENGSIIIVEGPKDVMWLHQNGFRNVIAPLGNGLTKFQKGLLLKNFLTIYLFLDGDNGGDVGKSAIFDKIKGYFNIYDVKIPDKKDPDDMTKEEIQHVISTANKIN